MAEIRHIETTCCIVGGGPAGMMLGFLLGRAGVETLVLEKHADFLRDFRGDTVHPSTLRIMDELGLLDPFLRLPHQKLHRLGAAFGDRHVSIGDFSGLPERHAFIAFMPQWDFLDFLARQGRHLPALRLEMRSRVDGLVEAGGRVVGVRGIGHGGDGEDLGGEPAGGEPFEVRAALTIGCDGRHSTLRRQAGLPLENIGAPIDVLWFRVGRDADSFDDTLGRIVPGRIVVTLDRGDYWQCAFVIAKDEADAIRARGIEAFRAEVARAAPVLAAHVADIGSWDDVKLLAVSIDRLTRWSRPGLLCIGDAAHAMSPVGGVGINLAIQDAVATANILAPLLRRVGAGTVDHDGIDRALDAVRRRRLFPTRVTQGFQLQVQQNVLVPVLGGGEGATLEVPLPVRLIDAVPPLQRLLARLVGMGVRPEHVESPAAAEA